MDYNVFFTKCKFRYVVIGVIGIALCLMWTSCTSHSNSKSETFVLEAYKINSPNPDYYLFKMNNEKYNCFYNLTECSNANSICDVLGCDIDTTLKLCIRNDVECFDTIYYSNYCFEQIIFDRISVCLTKDDSYIHCCNSVGQTNLKFKLNLKEIQILNNLIANCDLVDYNSTTQKRFLEDDYAINMRIRIVKQNRYCELLISDSSNEYGRFALLNSFILGLSKKYSNSTIDNEEPCFLVPIR